MQEYTATYIIKRLYSKHIRKYLARIFIAISVMIIVAICSAMNVKLAQPLLDEIFSKQDTSMLMNIAMTMLLISVIKGICEFFQNYLVKSVGQQILTDMQILLFNHLLHSDLSMLQSESAGKLISRFTNDITMMRATVSTMLIGVARHLFTVIGLIIVMFKLEATLSAMIFLAFPLAIMPIQYIGKKMRAVVYQTQDKLGDYTAKLDETFLSIKVVKSYNGEDFEVKNAQEITNCILKLYKKAIKLDSLTSPITEFLSGLAIAGIIVYGGLKVMEGASTAGSLLAFITAFFSAYRPFKSLLILNVNLQEGLAASKRIFTILDTKPIIFDSKEAKEIDFATPNIKIENVSLKFGEKLVFQDLNLEIPSGKSTAIIGESGSGKSSIINLLLKFYLPDSGKIYIDGNDISTIKIKYLRKQIALVTQESLLFDISVAQNIAYTTKATHEEIIQAARKASAHEFITQLPEGYSTKIGFQGYSLSGGQKQRIMLARAFLKHAPILILDEATSSLDPINENSILHSLQKINANITKIVVSHKISSIKDFDKIIVMHQGAVIEQGTHDQLMQLQGQYWHLYNKQQKIQKFLDE